MIIYGIIFELNLSIYLSFLIDNQEPFIFYDLKTQKQFRVYFSQNMIIMVIQFMYSIFMLDQSSFGFMLGTSLRSLFRTSVHLQNIHILHIIMKIYIFHSFMFVRLCYQVSQPIIKREQFFKREWTLTIFVISCIQVFSFECMNKPNV